MAIAEKAKVPGLFSGMEKAQYFDSGKYVAPGLYKTEVQRVKQGVTRQKRPFFVVEMKVLETSNKEHPVGTDMTWMAMLDQDAALGNIKHFISIAADKPLEAVTEEDAEEAVAEENPFAGITLRVMAVNILTKAKKDFTKVKFLPGDTSAADAQRALASEQASSGPTAA